MENITLPLLSEELILIGIDANNAAEAIRILAENMYAKGYVKETFADAVIRREELYPTGMPTEIPVGMPHTDVEHCLRPGISLGILKNPVAFRTMGEPEKVVAVNLIFLLSVVDPASQVKVLTRLVDFFQRTDQLQNLMNCQEPKEALTILEDGLNIRENHSGELPVVSAEPEFFETVVRNPSGLHARPAARFVQIARSFPCEILIYNLENSSSAANAKSIINVLSLEISQGHRVRVQASGEQASEALSRLRRLLEDETGDLPV